MAAPAPKAVKENEVKAKPKVERVDETPIELELEATALAI